MLKHLKKIKRELEASEDEKGNWNLSYFRVDEDGCCITLCTLSGGGEEVGKDTGEKMQRFFLKKEEKIKDKKT